MVSMLKITKKNLTSVCSKKMKLINQSLFKNKKIKTKQKEIKKNKHFSILYPHVLVSSIHIQIKNKVTALVIDYRIKYTGMGSNLLLLPAKQQRKWQNVWPTTKPN